MLNPEARRARSRLAAYRRWDGADPAELDRLTREYLNAANESGIDEKIDDLIDQAPRMTAAQVARIRRWANAEPVTTS
jgi:hypothetical protein